MIEKLDRKLPWMDSKYFDYQWRYVMTPEERALAQEMGLRHYYKPSRWERFLAWLYQLLP